MFRLTFDATCSLLLILLNRCVEIAAAKVPYDPYADLVASDLADTPAVLNAIDKGTFRCNVACFLVCFTYGGALGYPQSCNCHSTDFFFPILTIHS